MQLGSSGQMNDSIRAKWDGIGRLARRITETAEDKASHERQSSRASSQLWAEVNSAQKYGVAEVKFKQLHDSQVSGDESQSEWQVLRQPNFGVLLATVRIVRKR